MVRGLQSVRVPPDWMLPTNPKMVPYKGRGVVPEPVCANKVRNGLASADQGCSIASQGTRHVHGTPCWNPPTSNNHQPSHSSTCTALNLYSTCRGLWGFVVIWLSWLSGRALAAQARGVWIRLPATAGFFTFLYFCLITSNFQHGARCSEHPAIIIILCDVTELFCMCTQLTLYRPMCINVSYINIQMCVHVWYISRSHRNKIKFDLYKELSRLFIVLMNIGQNPYLVCTELRYKKMLCTAIGWYLLTERTEVRIFGAQLLWSSHWATNEECIYLYQCHCK